VLAQRGARVKGDVCTFEEQWRLCAQQR